MGQETAGVRCLVCCADTACTGPPNFACAALATNDLWTAFGMACHFCLSFESTAGAIFVQQAP